MERDQATKVWQFNSDKAAFDNKVAMGGLIQGLSAEIATVAKEVGGIKTQVSALDVRMTAMENGTAPPPKHKSAGKGKPVMRVDMSPRGADPFNTAGGDPWSQPNRRGIGSSDRSGSWAQWQPSWNEDANGEAPAKKNIFARNLAPRVGDRKTIIFGGFPRDTGRGDIEATLRGIVTGFEGVERVTSMGRYSTCGRISFEDNNLMWGFIKGNKRKKYDFDGVKDVLWLSVEKTYDERLKTPRVSYLVNKLVEFLTEKHKIPPLEARKRVDGDYNRGCIMFLTAAVIEVGEDGVDNITIKKKQQRIIDSKNGDRYFAKDEARELVDLKDFDWDEAISHVNGMISKAEAWAYS